MHAFVSRLLAVPLTLALATVVPAQEEPPAAWWDAGVGAALERAGERRATWEAELRQVPEELRPGVAYLVAHMPARDLAQLDPAYVTENVRLACAARARVAWGRELPEDVFLDAVLPYANVTEARDPWRAELFERCLPVVAECRTPGEAAQRLNETIFRELGVRYSTARRRADQSPKESIEQGLASCTGLSILLADACRAVAVPARLAGIPRWVNKPGNHTWIEVWDDGWHFTGAAEPDARGLDHAWFQGDAALARPGDRMHAIYAVTWRATGTTFPLVWARGEGVHAVDVTARYLSDAAPDAAATRPARLMVQVVAEEGGARLARPVRVRAVDAPALAFEGTSRDEGADTNDHLTFEVPRGRAFEVLLAEPGGEWVSVERVAIDGAGEALVRVAPPGGEALRAEAWARYRAGEHAARRADFAARRVRWREHESRYTLREVGEEPAGGWPLFIAMHGGGGVPKEVNDRQWRQMQRYYRDHPENGGYLYLALRAPNDRWNGFYDDTISCLVEELVQQLVLCAAVDPDRVVLMGYSHGGYGAFVIGTKIPYRFAAVHASAAAPTDGETRPENLRTTRFSYMVGEHDDAYGRRERCERFDARVKELRGEREEVYPVSFEYRPGHGHGGLPDRDKIAELYGHARDPVPRELTWHMTDDVLTDFFWLSVDEPGEGKRVSAACTENRIELETEGLERVTVWLDERLVDPSRPVTIVAGEVEQTLELEPRLETVLASLRRRGDPRLAFSVRVDLALTP